MSSHLYRESIVKYGRILVRGIEEDREDSSQNGAHMFSNVERNNRNRDSASDGSPTGRLCPTVLAKVPLLLHLPCRGDRWRRAGYSTGSWVNDWDGVASALS